MSSLQQATPRAAEESLETLLQRLESSQAGLTSNAAGARLARHGANELSSVRLRTKLLEQARAVANPLVLILLAAGLASALLGQLSDAIIIAGIVVMSAALDGWQTWRSERAIERLRAQVAPSATVLREGVWTELATRALVVGDVVRLSAGDLVPADARLLEAEDLHVQEAALTGESLPAEKRALASAPVVVTPESLAFVFLGTSVVSGTARAVVVATGARTTFGDIAERLAARPEETEYERGTRRFGVLILQVVFFLVLFILVINLGLGRDGMQSLLFSVALAVGLTPEFLPMITTVTLAQGAIRMAREKVIVKHLSAIQNLGSIDILCSDKTGTLTSGTMELDAAFDPLGKPDQRPLLLARVNSQLETGIRSPLDAAILAACPPQLGYEKLAELPFDFERRRLSVVAAREGERLLVTKGAPESVLAVCCSLELDGEVRELDEAARERCQAAIRGHGERGFRVLAVAYRRVTDEPESAWRQERELVLTGFLTFADHLLEDSAASIEALRRDGVQIKILTGDNELVTRHVCEQVGLIDVKLVLGRELEALDDDALAGVAEEAQVFARVSPAQKHRIILALKRRGHVVGFLGDGINDAPSLRGADVGISVAGAVDIARAASDLLLLDRHLGVLHAGILAGRRSFGNVLKYLLMGTSSNFGNMFSMAGASLLLPFLPMLPTQILLNNFLYDLAQITIPTDKVDETYLRRPQRWDLALLRRFMLVIGPVSSLYDFLTFTVLLHVLSFDETRFHTGWFLESLATQTLVLFVIRTRGRPWSQWPSAALTITTLAVVAVGLVLPYTAVGAALGLAPLPGSYFVFLALVVSSYLVFVELVKRRLWRSHAGAVEGGGEPGRVA